MNQKILRKNKYLIWSIFLGLLIFLLIACGKMSAEFNTGLCFFHAKFSRQDQNSSLNISAFQMILVQQ